jgi:Ca-activated chloride channel family protein
MNSLVALAIAVLLLLTLAAPMLAQSQSSPSTTDSSKSVPRPPTPPTFGVPPAAPSDDTLPTFKVDVKLVNVFVTVLDQKGAPVGSLTKDDFRLFEDGNPEHIAVFDRESQLPLSIVLAVDTSLSTRKDLRFELESARRFARSIMRPVDAMALYEFSEIVNEVVPFTADLKRIDRGISTIRSGSATALYDAVYLGSGTLEKRQGRKVMVVITDGGDTVSKVDYHEALRAAQQAEAIVYSIIVVPIPSSAGRDLGGEHALIQLSHDTGGKYYYADSLDRLDEAFSRISDELRTQYLLAYYPSRRYADSDFRRIEVRVHGEEDKSVPLLARYRTGYYTSKSR